MDSLELLKFLSEKYTRSPRYVSGMECIDALSVSEQEFVDLVQILEDDGHAYVLKTKNTLPQIKISSKGRKFLRDGEETPSVTPAVYNVENLTQVSGNVYGGVHQSDNRISITQKLEKLQSEIKAQDLLEDTKKEILQKIDEIKSEHEKNTESSREKITKIISDIGSIAAEYAPIVSRIMGM